MKAVAPHRRLAAPLDEDRNIPLREGARLLGVSPDSIRKREAPRGVETLTIIDGARQGAQRRLLFLRLSEVIALRDKLYEDARQQMNVDRMLADRAERKKHFKVV
jgi:hypothetical protein